ncbi:MAG: ribosome recycling factor [Rickettsiales bacterium]|jgi:ribosome recycling factor|nr:ribosome recycling factor [Rickettsiales bacterium]
MPAATIADVKKRMDGALNAFRNDLKGLRTGRASAGLLDTVIVEAYGSPMPLNQTATVSVPESRMISVQVWDKGLVSSVEKAIKNAGLGLNPMSDGNLVRVPIPDLSEERRKELVKVAGQFAEKARVAVRNVRRDGMDALKKLQKDAKISEDELHGKSDEIQKVTDTHIKQVDEALIAKEKEIMDT